MDNSNAKNHSLSDHPDMPQNGKTKEIRGFFRKSHKMIEFFGCKQTSHNVTSFHLQKAEAPARRVGHSSSEDHRGVASLSNCEFSNGAKTREERSHTLKGTRLLRSPSCWIMPPPKKPVSCRHGRVCLRISHLSKFTQGPADHPLLK